MLTQQIARNIGEAVDLLFDASGTSAVQSGQLMERLYRDLATIRRIIFSMLIAARRIGVLLFSDSRRTRLIDCVPKSPCSIE